MKSRKNIMFEYPLTSSRRGKPPDPPYGERRTFSVDAFGGAWEGGRIRRCLGGRTHSAVLGRADVLGGAWEGGRIGWMHWVVLGRADALGGAWEGGRICSSHDLYDPPNASAFPHMGGQVVLTPTW
jgi:hypothetical protein